MCRTYSIVVLLCALAFAADARDIDTSGLNDQQIAKIKAYAAQLQAAIGGIIAMFTF